METEVPTGFAPNWRLPSVQSHLVPLAGSVEMLFRDDADYGNASGKSTRIPVALAKPSG